MDGSALAAEFVNRSQCPADVNCVVSRRYGVLMLPVLVFYVLGAIVEPFGEV